MNYQSSDDDITFDSLASTYDENFTQSQIGRLMRNDVHRLLVSLWDSGDKVLELGCGTGEDARWLSQQGINVCATDTSPHMRKIATTKLNGMGDVKALNLNGLPATWHERHYNGVLANFGVINCVNDIPQLAQWLAKHTAIGAHLVFVVMARYCLWEMLWHGLHGDFATARRRWNGTSFVSDSNPQGIDLRYPTIAHMNDIFAPYFHLQQVMPLGFALPPSDIYGMIENRPRALAVLRQLELWAQKRPFLANFADHYVIVLTK